MIVVGDNNRDSTTLKDDARINMSWSQVETITARPAPDYFLELDGIDIPGLSQLTTCSDSRCIAAIALVGFATLSAMPTILTAPY
jgi:hypothetical protein